MPRFRSRAGSALVTELEERLRDATPDFDTAEAAFEEGFLELSGVVPDVASKREAEAAARSTRGVVGVANGLRTDTGIAARVRAALADDHRTDLADINVVSERGIVTLSGKVDTAAVRQAAEEVAEAQKGVIDVINDLPIEKDQFTSRLHAGLEEGLALPVQLGEASRARASPSDEPADRFLVQVDARRGQARWCTRDASSRSGRR